MAEIDRPDASGTAPNGKNAEEEQEGDRERNIAKAALSTAELG